MQDIAEPDQTPEGQDTLALAQDRGLGRAVELCAADVLVAISSAQRVQATFRPCEDLTQDIYPAAQGRG